MVREKSCELEDKGVGVVRGEGDTLALALEEGEGKLVGETEGEGRALPDSDTEGVVEEVGVPPLK